MCLAAQGAVSVEMVLNCPPGGSKNKACYVVCQQKCSIFAVELNDLWMRACHGLSLLALSTCFSPAYTREEQLWEPLDLSISHLNEGWQDSHSQGLPSSAVSDLETAHTSDGIAIKESDDSRSRTELLLGVQRVLRSLRKSALINKMNLQKCRRLRAAFQNQTIVSGKRHQEAKYDLRQSTGDMDGLSDIAYNVELAQQDAAQKAKKVSWKQTRVHISFDIFLGLASF